MWGNDRRGAVLVILLWMLTGMSILCITFARAIRVETAASANHRLLASAYYLAKAGIAEATYRLVSYRMEATNRMIDPTDEPPPLDIDRGKVVLRTDIGDATVQVADENGKLNLNTVEKPVLLELLRVMGVEKDRADVVADSIIDWRDADEEAGPSGAENPYYQALPTPYRCKNAPFDTLEELLLVRGVDAGLLFGTTIQDEMGRAHFRVGLNRCLSVYGAPSGVNVNAAPAEVLQAIGFTPDMARQIVTVRAEKPFKDVNDFSVRIPGVPPSQDLKVPLVTATPFKFSFYSLVSTGAISGTKLRKTIRAVVRLNGRFPLKFSTVYWDENYFLQEQD